MLSLAYGKKLVQSARQAVNSKLEKKQFELSDFKQLTGVFVTIHSYPGNELRGCIGFTEPAFTLNKALVKAAEAAAFSDPRFKPIQKEELDHVIFEVSVLTKPELIEVRNAEDYKKQITIGIDGLVAEQNGFKGLLLPQVAPEHNMDKEEFLSCTCEKAGLPPNSWKDIKSVKIYKFQTQIFKEIKPNGDIIHK